MNLIEFKRAQIKVFLFLKLGFFLLKDIELLNTVANFLLAVLGIQVKCKTVVFVGLFIVLHVLIDKTEEKVDFRVVDGLLEETLKLILRLVNHVEVVVSLGLVKDVD